MNLKRETLNLSVITSIGISASILFHVFLGRKFGPGKELDCFFIALTFFSWVCLFSNFINSLYIPVFNDVKKNSLKDSLVFADVVIKTVLLLSVIIVILTLFLDIYLIKILAPGFSRESIILTKELNGILIFAVIFHSISNTVLMTLNALYHYSVPALTDFVDPIFNLTALFILVPFLGIKGIAVSYLASNFVKAIYLLCYLYLKTGWRPTLNFYHPYLPKLINRSFNGTLNSFVWSLRDLIIRNVASRLGEGTVTLFSYAEKFVTIFIQVTINPIVRVFYSRISELISLEKLDEVKRVFLNTVRINLSISFFISAGAVVFFQPVLAIVLRSNKFTSGDIQILSTLLSLMLFYFIILSFEYYLSRIIFASQKIIIALLSASFAVAVIFILLPGLSKIYGIYALPFGIIIPQVIVCILHYLYVKKYLGLSSWIILKNILPSFLVAFVFLVFALGIKSFINNNFIMLFCFLPAWLMLYFAAVKLFLKEEAKVLFTK